ncbi:MAG: protein-export chaperone SecB [Oscillospiraceae bacterium]|nr:protein-export chaperone SecB [Oscillospiraceae bacterium]
MANVQMKAYKVRELVFHNTIQGKVQLKLSNKVSHNVRYMQPDLCEGTMTVEVFDKEQPDVLSVKITVVGLFQIKKQVEKEFIHVDTFKELFPFAKAIVATVSANAGIQPIMVQDVDIESQEIYRFDLPKRRPKEDDQ